jgi:hypothetical protein
MTDDLPTPPIPSDVDLRDFSFTPIFRARLFSSSFHSHASDAEWRAAVTLWLKSWDQMPAGSLPIDDVELCRLAELGKDLKRWKRVRARALHGWFQCSDGRLYHRVVAEGVLEAYGRRRAASSHGKAGALHRWSPSNARASKRAMPEQCPSISSGNARAMPADSNRQGSRREGKVKGTPEDPVLTLTMGSESCVEGECEGKLATASRPPTTTNNEEKK